MSSLAVAKTSSAKTHQGCHRCSDQPTAATAAISSPIGETERERFYATVKVDGGVKVVSTPWPIVDDVNADGSVHVAAIVHFVVLSVASAERRTISASTGGSWTLLHSSLTAVFVVRCCLRKAALDRAGRPFAAWGRAMHFGWAVGHCNVLRPGHIARALVQLGNVCFMRFRRSTSKVRRP